MNSFAIPGPADLPESSEALAEAPPQLDRYDFVQGSDDLAVAIASIHLLQPPTQASTTDGSSSRIRKS